MVAEQAGSFPIEMKIRQNSPNRCVSVVTRKLLLRDYQIVSIQFLRQNPKHTPNCADAVRYFTVISTFCYDHATAPAFVGLRLVKPSP